MLIIALVMVGMFAFGIAEWPSNDGSQESADVEDMPQTIIPPPDDEWDSMDEVGFTYTVAGSTTSTIFYDTANYHIEAWHGTTTETAMVVAIFDFPGPSPMPIDLDWTVIDGGAYQRGNGALGFKITNQNNGMTWFGWVWEE